MKMISLLTLFVSFTAHAADTWLGDLTVRNDHRGIVTTVSATGQTIYDNLADYNYLTVSFEFYKKGVTDVPGAQVWQEIDARVELVKDSTNEIISRGVIDVAGVDGNNAVYRVTMQNINPSTVAGYDPEMLQGGVMKTHLHLLLDGSVMASIPFGYSYVP